MEVTGIALVLVFVVTGAFILPTIIWSRKTAAESRATDRFSPRMYKLPTDEIFNDTPDEQRQGGEAMSAPTLTRTHDRPNKERQQLEAKRLQAIALRQKAATRRLVLFLIECVATIGVAVAAGFSVFSAWYVLIPVVLMGATVGLGRKAAVDGRKADTVMRNKIEAASTQPVTTASTGFPAKRTFTPTEIKWTTRTTNVCARDTSDATSVTDTQADTTSQGTDSLAHTADSASPTVEITPHSVQTSPVEPSAKTPATTPQADSDTTPAEVTNIVDRILYGDDEEPVDEANDIHYRDTTTVDSDARGRVEGGWEPQALPKPLYALKPSAGRRDVATAAIRQVNATDDQASDTSTPFRPVKLSDTTGDTLTSQEIAGSTFAELDEILDRRRAL